MNPLVTGAEQLLFNDRPKSPYFGKQAAKVLMHPGEVNKIRECPEHPNLIVTHTDAPELYLWNLDRQPNVAKDDKDISVPDLVLQGHEGDARFACNWSSGASRPMVCSGGEDHLVCVWDLQDSMSSLLQGSHTYDRAKGVAGATSLSCRSKLKGHKDTVEDVCFQPRSNDVLASVGDDE